MPLTSLQFSDHNHLASTSINPDGACSASVMDSVEGTPADGGSHQRIAEMVIDEFGDDPVERTSEMRILRMTAALADEETIPEAIHNDPSAPRPLRRGASEKAFVDETYEVLG